MLQEVVSIHGPCPARSPAATFSAKASTTDVELASSGALAGTGAFQKLVDAKKRKGADRNGADSSDPPSTGVDSSDAPFSGPGGSAEVPVAAPDPETPGTEPDSEAPVAASDPEMPGTEPDSEAPVAAPDPETPGTEPDSEAPVAASDPEMPSTEPHSSQSRSVLGCQRASSLSEPPAG